MTFATDDIYRLGGSQRAKLQYHILAQSFPLVHVDEQDKADSEAFAAQLTQRPRSYGLPVCTGPKATKKW